MLHGCILGIDYLDLILLSLMIVLFGFDIAIFHKYSQICI